MEIFLKYYQNKLHMDKFIIMKVLPLFLFLSVACLNSNDLTEPEQGCFPNCFQQGVVFEFVWEEPIAVDSSQCFFDHPKIYNNQLIYIRSFCGANQVLNSRNKNSGIKNWSWSDPQYIGDGNYFTATGAMAVTENSIILGRERDLYRLNITNGQTGWSIHYPEGWGSNPNISTINGILYQSENKQITNRTESYLLAIPEDEFNNRDTVFSIKEPDGYRPNIFPPSGWKNEKDETVLVFQNRQWNFDAVDGKIDLYAYNVTADSIYWVIDDLVPDGNSNVRPPLIEGNRVFFLGGRTLFCIDVETGAILWDRQFNNGASGLLTSNVILAEGKLIVNPDDRTLYALDPETGATLWSDDDSGSNCSNMVAHDGIVYFTSAGRDRLYAVDIHTGEHYWEERSPHRRDFPNAQFVFQGVAVDPETGYVYTSDKYFIMCLKPPKR
jgi:outer membrane protein assembly factor BamB